MPYGMPPLTPQQAAALAAAGMPRVANASIPTGMAITTTSETTFSQKLTIPGGTLTPGTVLRLLQFGRYSSVGVTPSITPRIRLGGVSLLPDRLIMGLLGDTNSPWRADAEFVVTDGGVVGSGILFIADNQARIFGGGFVTGFNFASDLDLTSSAQWGQAGCSITCQGWYGEVLKPSA